MKTENPTNGLGHGKGRGGLSRSRFQGGGSRGQVQGGEGWVEVRSRSGTGCHTLVFKKFGRKWKER